jgi:hypothetical protein
VLSQAYRLGCCDRCAVYLSRESRLGAVGEASRFGAVPDYIGFEITTVKKRGRFDVLALSILFILVSLIAFASSGI